jgi:predicted ribosome quality control (RQC) complex YloA/Tae2 family protein
MATLQGMSGLDLITITDEITRLLPLWVHKVYLDEKRLCVIRFNSKEQGKFSLLIEPGRRMHLIEGLCEFPQNPPSFAMFLRKYLNGGRVCSIRQYGLQRTVIIDIQKSDQMYHLIIEIYDEGNIILCGEDYKIIQPLTRQRFKDRDVLPGSQYLFPPPDVSSISIEEFSEKLRSDDRDIVRALAVGSFLGGRYAEYICAVTGTDKKTAARDTDTNRIYLAIHSLLDTVKTDPKPVITSTGCHAIPAAENVLSSYDTFNLALSKYYPIKIPEKKVLEKKEISREDRIRKQQEGALVKFRKNIEKNEETVSLIYENYGIISGVIESLSKAALTRSWQEIEEILKQDKSGASNGILKVYPSDAAIDLNLSRPVKIFVNETIDQNAGRYYDQIKKFKKKTAGAHAAMERTLPKHTSKKSQYIRPKKRWFDRFRWFYTSDQVLVIGGRDAGQNEELIKKYLEGGDTFVHADAHGSSVVVVKGKTDNWDEVTGFAAAYSGAWRSGFASVDVYSAKPTQVSKTVESGEFLSKGSFVVRGEREWYHNIPLEIAIGLALHSQTRIVGGPVNAVSKLCDNYIILHPGTFEPNDIAKKVVRTLKDKLTEDEQKALKFALNTEAVASFVPPGGSDLVRDESR